jgi:hypothetical protein
MPIPAHTPIPPRPAPTPEDEKEEDDDSNPVDRQEKLLTELARFADLGEKGYKYVLYFSHTQTQ